MAGKIVEYSYKSYSGKNHTIRIWDNNATSDALEGIEGDALKMTYESGERNDAYSPFLKSKATFSVQVENDTQEGVVQALIDGEEGRYILEFLADTSGNDYLGVILTDQIEKPRDAYPYWVELTAVDGINRLKNVREALPTSVNKNLVALLLELVKKTGINDFLDVGDSLLVLVADYWEDAMPNAFNKNTDPFRYVRAVDARALQLKEGNDSIIEYESYYQMLEWVLITFGLRLLASNKRYHVIQVDSYRTTFLKYHIYPNNVVFNDNGGVVSGVVVAENIPYNITVANQFQVLDGDVWSYAPMVRDVIFEADLRPGVIQMPPFYVGEFGVTQNFDTAVGGDPNLQMNIGFEISESWTNSSPPASYRIKWQFEIRVGIYYLVNPGGVTTWSTTAGTYNVWINYPQQAQIITNGTIGFQILPGNLGNANSFFEINAPVAPISVFGGTVQVRVSTVYQSLSGTSLSTFTNRNIEGRIYITYGNSGNNVQGASGVKYFIGTNPKGSYQIRKGSTPFADSPGSAASGRLQVYDGTDWVDAQDWRRHSPTADKQRLIQVVIDAMYKSQQKPLSILNASIVQRSITPRNTIVVEGKQLLFQRGTLNTETDTWEDGSWIEIRAYDSQVTVNNDIGPAINNDARRSAAAPWGGMMRSVETQIVVTRLSAAASGDVTTLSIDAPGVDVGGSGDKLLLAHPVSGESQELVLSAGVFNDSTSLSVNSITLDFEYPEGSIISVPLTSIMQRISDLEAG